MRLSSRLTRFIVGMVIAIAITLHPPVGSAAESVETLLQQSQQRYEAGQIDEAKSLLHLLQQQTQGQGLTAAVALSNLALIASDQGDWASAQTTLKQSLEILQAVAPTPKKNGVMAQVLNVQGRVQLAQGDANAALQTWKQAETHYGEVHNQPGVVQSKIRQAQALQAMGLHYRAYQEILQSLQTQLEQQPDSVIKAGGLRSLGEAVGVVGDRANAKKIMEDSLAIAQRLNNPSEIAASQLTLANLLSAKIREGRNLNQVSPEEIAFLQSDIDQAIKLYQDAAAIPSVNQRRANLNRLALLVNSQRPTEASQFAATLQSDMLALPPDRPSIEARLNFANSLLTLAKISKQANGEAMITLLTTAVEQARQLNDPRLIANALGNLGRAQEQDKRFDLAQATTEQALLLAKSANASEQVYRWSAQLGRLQEQRGNYPAAIQSYTQAVNILRNLRQDLLGINADTQLVEAEMLEPVHRQLVNLLLPQDGSPADSKTIQQIREVIDSLQLEEINNYLRTNCLQSKVEIDKIEVPQKTAIVYPIILPDRIAIIVSSTGQEPKLYPPQRIAEKTVKATVKKLQEGLRDPQRWEWTAASEQLYSWLIQPIQADLQQQKVETLVFVLDGAFRNIPMAALKHGEQYLIEQYSLATTPGLKLTKPEPLQARVLLGVAFGLTKARTEKFADGSSKFFPKLDAVADELKYLKAAIRLSPVEPIWDFTHQTFQQTLQQSRAPIVHLATHGQFSSNLDKTFLLAADGRITSDELTNALGASNNTRTTAIELLVLSACETAAGDDRAPLGLAGIALKSGARSTVASLWQVQDTTTSLLMQRFYQEVTTPKVSKAAALRQAQLSVLNFDQDSRPYSHPYYWAPFILVGNWL
jgi:CHAT domain-containing protein